MTLMTDPPTPTPGPRGTDPLTAIVIICIVGFGLFWLFGDCARAQADPVVAASTARPTASIDWGAIGGIIGAIAGAIGAIFGGISMALHAIAPRTKTTVDDKLAASIDSLHAKVDDGAIAVAAVFSALRALQPPAVVRVPPPPTPAPGSGTAAMLAILLLGGLASSTLTGCATGKAALAEGSVAFLSCEDGHIDAATLADFKAGAATEIRHLLAGGPTVDTAALKADLTPLKSDAARCGWAAAIATLGALLPTSTPGTAVSALASSSPAPAAVRAQFSVAARLAGWPPLQLAGGDVM